MMRVIGLQQHKDEQTNEKGAPHKDLEGELTIHGIVSAKRTEFVEHSSALFVLPIPSGYNPTTDNAGNIHTFLESQGLDVVSVSVGTEILYIESEQDPTSLIEAYTSPVDDKQQLKQQLQSLNTDNIEQFIESDGDSISARGLLEEVLKLKEAVNIIKELMV